jgi:hypothetical protein
VHRTGLEIDETRRPVGIVDDSLPAAGGPVVAARDQSRRRSPARAKGAVRAPLPHRPEESSIRDAGLEDEWRRSARQLEADALAGDLRRRGLQIRMAHTEGNDGATSTEDERDLPRSVQGVRAGPGTDQLGVGALGSLGAGAQDQGEWNGDRDETLQAVLLIVRRRSNLSR